MRYFLLIFFFSAVLVLAWAGFRGEKTRRPPIELFPDMDRQPKLRPQAANDFFPDGRSSRLPVAGTIVRSAAYQNLVDADAGKPVYPHNDAPANTGMITGTTNFVEHSPFQISAQLMARGRDRYQITCSPCHGAMGDGNGITKKLGAMLTVANLHDQRLVRMTDGELFYVTTNGRGLMGPYGPQVEVEDRWAIVAYVRALQRSRLATLDDVPEQLRNTLKK
ncbi:MAG: cytochrome c [Verrucomicrobia bacterium]|nr:cytochrome c [Verrucomicrobiota bacterium]